MRACSKGSLDRDFIACIHKVLLYMEKNKAKLAVYIKKNVGRYCVMYLVIQTTNHI